MHLIAIDQNLDILQPKWFNQNWIFLVNFAVTKKKMSKTRRILAIFLVTLFATYYCETTFFVHTHTFHWGSVTHSHPYHPSAKHSHDQIECQAISALSNITVCMVSVTAPLLFVPALIFSVEVPMEQAGVQGVRVLPLLRAPPRVHC